MITFIITIKVMANVFIIPHQFKPQIIHVSIFQKYFIKVPALRTLIAIEAFLVSKQGLYCQVLLKLREIK